MDFHSIEFYVIAVIAAAAIIGFAARPAVRGEARTWLLPATLTRGTAQCTPSIIITCDDRFDLTIRRTGLPEVEAVNMSVTIVGHDISIEEHCTSANHDHTPSATTAETVLTFIGPDRYHLSYAAPDLSLFTAVQFTARPGITINKQQTLS